MDSSSAKKIVRIALGLGLLGAGIAAFALFDAACSPYVALLDPLEFNPKYRAEILLGLLAVISFCAFLGSWVLLAGRTHARTIALLASILISAASCSDYFLSKHPGNWLTRSEYRIGSGCRPVLMIEIYRAFQPLLPVRSFYLSDASGDVCRVMQMQMFFLGDFEKEKCPEKAQGSKMDCYLAVTHRLRTESPLDSAGQLANLALGVQIAAEEKKNGASTLTSVMSIVKMIRENALMLDDRIIARIRGRAPAPDPELHGKPLEKEFTDTTDWQLATELFNRGVQIVSEERKQPQQDSDVSKQLNQSDSVFDRLKQHASALGDALRMEINAFTLNNPDRKNLHELLCTEKKAGQSCL